MATIDQATLYETFAQSVESYLLWDKLKAEPHQSGDNEGIIIGTETADTYEARKHMAGLWIVGNARSVAEAVQTLRLDPIPILAIANKVKNPDNGPPAVRAAWPDAKAILDAATILQERDKGQAAAAVVVDEPAEPPASIAPTAEATQQSPPAQAVSASEVARLLHLIGDGDGIKVLTIARNESRTAEQRMIELVRMDQRYDGYNSVQWGELLAVDPAAVRQTEFWKQRKHRKEWGYGSLSGSESDE